MPHKVRRVLAIDDNRLDLKMIDRSFTETGDGTTVETCLGSESALETIRCSEPDLVLLDISMPGLDGFEVMEHARRALKNAPIVVMLSSSEDPTDIERAYAEGAAAYVVKPDSLAGYRGLAHSVSEFWTSRVVRPD